MSRLTTIRPDFVEFVPKELKGGILYISIPFNTAVHRCACGCGAKITTPIGPARWQFSYDGETVSLHPSIGNWSYPCRSHYWIEQNRIRWATKWSRNRIEAGRASDKTARDYYHQSKTGKAETGGAHDTDRSPSKVGQWLRNLFRR